MPDDADAALRDLDGFRHALGSGMTIILAQTQLLQRQLAHMDGVSDGHRQRLDRGLAVILNAAQAVDSTIAQIPEAGDEREAS